MRALKIPLVTGVILAAIYLGAGVLVAWLANARQAEQEEHLVRLTGYGQSQLAELAGITDAMEPVVQACKDLPQVGADDVVQYLGPPPPDAPATGQALAIGFDQLSGVRDGRLVARPASAQPQVPGLGQRLVSVLTTAPWAWGRLVGSDSLGPQVARARYLIVARPTLLPKQAGGAADSPVGGLTVMQVAVLDAASGQVRCRGGLADQRPADRAARTVGVLALHHLCALGGSALCQLTNHRLNSDK